MALYINKTMVDGVEELPRLTEEEFLAIPVAERPKIWVKRNATETDRGITAEDVQYSSTQNVKEKIDEVAGRKTVWTGNLYTVNDEFTIPNFSTNKKYVFFFRGFSSSQIEQFIAIPITYMQFIVQGDTTQYRRYRINAKDGLLNGTFKIVDIYGSGDSGTALIQIDEI